MAAAHLVPSAHATYGFAQLSRHVENTCAKARRSKLAAKGAIAFLRQGIFATNRREQQEIATLCLQLLQHYLMRINALLVQRTLAQRQLLEQLSEDGRRALSPLFYEHAWRRPDGDASPPHSDGEEVGAGAALA